MDAAALEESWYRVCQTCDFISEATVREYTKGLKKAKNHFALNNGLRGYVRERCPRCGERGYFKVYRMGQLNHPGCASWRMNLAAFAARSFAQAVEQAAKGMPVSKPAEAPEPPKGPVCANCGEPFPDDRQFCVRCGKRRSA